MLSEPNAEFENLCDLIIGRALDSYVKSEYGNLWETHQCRPHAYGKKLLKQVSAQLNYAPAFGRLVACAVLPAVLILSSSQLSAAFKFSAANFEIKVNIGLSVKLLLFSLRPYLVPRI